MAKRHQVSIVDVWNWLVNEVLESGDLNANEQATLIHVIAKLNRNMWRPAKINYRIIGAAIGRDARTVATAIKKLEELQIIENTEGGVTVGRKYYQPATSDLPAEGTNTTGSDIRSPEPVEVNRPATRKRKIFNQS